MANEINVTNTYCGCGGSKVILANGQCEENPVFKKVDELPGLGDATRNHAYVLPDNTAWIVNNDGTGFSQLNSSGDGEAYDDTELRGFIQQALDRNTMEDNRLTNIENKNAAQDERIAALENRPSGGETYDDTAIKDRLDALEDKTDNDTTYTAGTGISISADNVISATGGGSTYDDTEIKDRLEALEDCVIEEGGRQVVNITDQLKTYDEPLVVDDRTFDKYIDITFDGTNAIPGTEDIYQSGAFGIFSLVVDKGDGSEPTPYLDSFSGDVLLKPSNVLFDPSKTTRISFDSAEFSDFNVDIVYETAGGCLSERVEAIEAVLRNLGYM